MLRFGRLIQNTIRIYDTNETGFDIVGDAVFNHTNIVTQLLDRCIDVDRCDSRAQSVELVQRDRKSPAAFLKLQRGAYR